MVASSAIPQQLVLLISQVGGAPTGNEAALVETTRDRFSAHKIPRDASEEQLRRWFLYGCVPVVRWLQSACPDIVSWGQEKLGVQVWVSLQIIAGRAHFLRKFKFITQDDAEWAEVERVLLDMLRGVFPPHPAAGALQSPTSNARSRASAALGLQVPEPPLWARKRDHAWLGFLSSGVSFYYGTLLETGRERLRWLAYSLLWFVVCLLYLYFGKAALPEFVWRTEPPAVQQPTFAPGSPPDPSGVDS